eukprot:TRINITY_DN6364_c0_g1_i1.p1 TRINITY_DN6364_c0_g1~~TRINITY_DN6364_c0_g1_i1.p1  ORF type:complete len:104 (+),score=7.12 TRINITY_DN6364_c0_g1_i1:36-314(+)
MPVKHDDRDSNPYNLAPGFRWKLPRRPKMEAPCANIFMSLVDCYEANEFDKTKCADALRGFEECRKLNSGKKRFTLNYHLINMIKGKYRIAP